MAAAAVGLLVSVLHVALAHAACDAIPSARRTFRSATASVDRPFAKPGDWVEIAIDPQCHGAERRFADAAADHVVTLAFVPPRGAVAGPDPVARIVVLAKSPQDQQELLDACRSRSDVARADVLRVNRPGQVKEVVRRGERTLAFRLPDTDALLGAVADDATLSGPVRIAVTRAGDPLPCALASRGCGAAPDAIACIDELYADDGSCNPTPDETFAQFTALPPPNDYHALCTDPIPPCDPTPVRNVRYALDADGNILVPMDWRGILVNSDAVPVPRLLRGSATITAFPESVIPLQLPDRRALSSYAFNGAKLPPLFEPQVDPSSGGLTLFGTADAPETVLRIARRSGVCAAGERAGLYCSARSDCDGAPCAATCPGEPDVECRSDADCTLGHCGSLFDLASRGSAAAPLTTGADGLVALDPVALDGLVQTETMDTFVRSEALAARDTDGDDEPDVGDLNGDGDFSDEVLTIADRGTGIPRPIGLGGALGRAIARIWQTPFSAPALAVHDDLLAFLEPEPQQFARDANGNGRVLETLLRVYRPDGADLTASIDPPIAADAAPVIDGESLRISEGKVFFRARPRDQLPQKVSRVSVDSNGNSGNGDSGSPSLSRDGRFVAFVSSSSNLVSDDRNEMSDIFVRDREAGTTERISVSWDGHDADGSSSSPSISSDGSIVVFVSDATNAVAEGSPAGPSIYVHDRRARRTIRVGPQDLPGGRPPDTVRLMAISPDGKWILFEAAQQTGETAFAVAYLYSLEDDHLERIKEALNTRTVHQTIGDGALSSDARTIAYAFLDILTDDDGFFQRITSRIHVIDRASRTDEEIVGPWWSGLALSSDGRLLMLEDLDDVIPGDTNGQNDVLTLDVQAGRAERVSVRPGGGQFARQSFGRSLSSDGRFVTFVNGTSERSFEDPFFVYLHDRSTRISTNVRLSGERVRASEVALSADASALAFTTFESIDVDDQNRCERTDPEINCSPDLSGLASECDGIVDYTTCAHTSLTCKRVDTPAFIMCSCTPPSYFTGCSDIYVQTGDDGADHASDLAGATLSTLAPGNGDTLREARSCDATFVAISNGIAAFLHPETVAPQGSCAAGSLNGDSDTDDQVVHFWDGAGPVANLGRAAHAVAVSETAIAALVSEHDDGGASDNPTADADTDDDVVQVHPASASGEWWSTGQAATQVAIHHRLVAFLTPEAAQGHLDLNRDGDDLDTVLQVVDASGTELQPRSGVGDLHLPMAAKEFVIGGEATREIVAYRTREASEGRTDLNDDGDAKDNVLLVYDAATDRVLSTHQAVTPCLLEACDPRVPYRVLKDTVRFLTFECEQSGPVKSGCKSGGTDLNGDGDAGDLVLQTFNVRQALAASSSGAAGVMAVSAAEASRRALHVVAATSAGVCTDSGDACASDATCSAGTCFVPPGGCIRDLEMACAPAATPGERTCPLGQFCSPTPGGGGAGTCKVIEGTCSSDDDCSAGAICSEGDQGVHRVTDPLSAAEDDSGAAVFFGAGRCVAVAAACTAGVDCECTTTSDCMTGSSCVGGICRRTSETCRSDQDCPTGELCEQLLIAQVAADSDGDEVPDATDNCPALKNVRQDDTDGDGAGDACDARTCGNGVLESGEACDDGNRYPGDGCDCRIPLCEGGGVLGDARLTLSRIGGRPGDELLTFRGRLVIPDGRSADFDPATLEQRGAQLLVEDFGASGRTLLDLSRRTWPVPGGGQGTGCDRARDGWRSFPAAGRFVYENRSNAFPSAACAPGSAGGLVRLEIEDRRASVRSLEVVVKVRNATIPVPTGGLRMTVVLGADEEQSARQVCATGSFAAMSCNRGSSGQSLVCR